MPRVVENETAPVGVESLAGIGMLVEVGAVKIAQPVTVSREMGRDPVEDHADLVLVQTVDQGGEILRRAVAAGRGEIAVVR